MPHRKLHKHKHQISLSGESEMQGFASYNLSAETVPLMLLYYSGQLPFIEWEDFTDFRVVFIVHTQCFPLSYYRRATKSHYRWVWWVYLFLHLFPSYILFIDYLNCNSGFTNPICELGRGDMLSVCVGRDLTVLNVLTGLSGGVWFLVAQ